MTARPGNVKEHLMGASIPLVVVDVLLRRLFLPFVLILSAVFRYNVLSLVNLLLLFVSLILPGPHLKTHKASYLIYLSLLTVWSLVAVLGQALFQIILATNYSDQLQPCSIKESNWRQFGFILYRGGHITGVDVIRHLLPDILVFLTALATLIVNGYIVRKSRRSGRGDGETTITEEPVDVQEVTSEETAATEIPSHIQCYWQLPCYAKPLFEVSTFITLGLSGVAVPSLTSFTYYGMFLIMLGLWSFHQTGKWKGAIRCIRCGLTFYTMLHLVALYLYQFQAAQQNIPQEPDDTTKSVLARLFGLTPVIFTNCDHPSRLLLYSDVDYPLFVNPALLLFLCLLLATDMRLWINTPDILWRNNEVYYLPVRDSPPSPTISVISSARSSPLQWTDYGTYQMKGATKQAAAVVSGDETEGCMEEEYRIYVEESGVDKPKATTQNGRQRTWQYFTLRIISFMKNMWHSLLLISYVPAIFCMMLWSVLYPSWPALLLLLWACVIWLIPKFTPKDSLFYTSPALAVYAVCLLVLQYVFSLNLTPRELSPVDGLGEECYGNSTPGCKSIVPLIKTAFTMVFFCALREFMRMMLNRRRSTRDDEATDDNKDEETSVTFVQEIGAGLLRNGLLLLSSYWILVVVAAFLLVFLAGEPNLFKTIYLVFFFIFLFTYQVFRRWWYYACVPVWWGLVLYAALELILIYTYQFTVVSDAWEQAFNKTSGLSVDSEDLFNSIGLIKHGINSLRSLSVSLVPPAVFIAVMAIQLRYFNPMSGSSTLLLRWRPIRTVQSFKKSTNEFEGVEGTASSKEGKQPSPEAGQETSAISYFHQVSSYLLKKVKHVSVLTVEISWRFFELHLHKLSMLLLFVVVLSEVSAGYWVLLIASLIIIPLPYFNIFLYPLLTVYIGLLLVLKTIYQFPIVNPNKFNLTTFNGSNDGGQCSETLNITSYLGNYSGSVFDYRYSSRLNDGGWFGLHKVPNYAQYIAGPLCLALLLSLHFSTKRHQSKVYHSKNIVIKSWEQKSLFFNIPRQKAETSFVAACQYFINHVFEMYGIEITLILIAISVAVRIDVYGVFYCIVLGVFLVFPRRIMAPIWLLYTVIHGLLLILQYSMLLGVPPGACFYPGGERGYPWDDIVPSSETNFGLRKWLFLADYPQILDKTVLYVDFMVYVLLCFQLYNFGNIKELREPLPDFMGVESLMNFIKVFVTKYYFWISIFLIFFGAITRVSFFGFLYLLLCFILLYRGQNMLMDRKKKRIKSWAVVRYISWAILLLRVSVQIVGCVFYQDIRKSTECALILVFNGGCNRERFYGSPEPNCAAYPSNIGLWVDVLTFAVITIQILIFDTQYSELMCEYLTERDNRASYLSGVLEVKMEERQQKAASAQRREFEELEERVQQLNSSENTIDHILHAGVRLPSNVNVRTEKMPEVASRPVLTSSEEFSVGDVDDVQPKSKLSPEQQSETNIMAEESSKLSRMRKFIYVSIVQIIDTAIEWLEKSSSLYMDVVEELKQQQQQNATQKLEVGSEMELYTPRSSEVQQEKRSEIVVEGDESVIAPAFSSASPKDEGRTNLSPAIDIEPVVPDDEVSMDGFERKVHEVAGEYTRRPVRFMRAVQYALLAHAEYVIYFLVVLNVMLNGSLLSLGYVCLLFAWGLLCIPWPSKKFWLSMIFYSMLVLVLKYGFQFYDIDYNDEDLQSETGFSTSSILGIVYYQNSVDFFRNAVWDMLLLIALLINRGLLKQSGLWRDDKKSQTSILERVKADTKRFYSRLLSPEISQGAADYYVIMLFFDVLCFITIIFGISSFGVGIGSGGLGQAATYIQNNYVPVPFVVMLLLQFFSMLVDRAIYLRHALKVKFVFQIILLIVWHLWLLFILPSESVTKIPFTRNTAAQCLYFFKSLYFIVSAMQIIAGYPTRVLGFFLGKHYTTVSGVVFSGYRAIPVLPELREIMDWVFTDTALPLFHWLRVQEIYAKLYLVKVRRQREKDSPRNLGDKQGLVIKVLLGGILLVCLVMLIWGPLLVISLINTTSVANTPVAATITLSLDAFEPLVQIRIQKESISPLTNSEYRHLKNSLLPEVQPQFQSEVLRSDFTKASFPNESTSLWTISPPAKLLLLNNLESVRKSNASISMQLSWTIQREPVISSATEVVSGLNSRRLNYQQDSSTIDNLISTLGGNMTNVSLLNLYPRVIYAPDAGPSVNYTELSRYFTTSAITCHTNLLTNTSNQQWWTLDECTDPIFTEISGQPTLLIYSERIASEIFGVIAGFGIIGLYVSVVLVIGRLIRSSVSSLPTELLLDEIVNPEKLLELCSDIFVVRESHNFKLEEILVGKLFAIFRSPEQLIEMTENIKCKQD